MRSSAVWVNARRFNRPVNSSIRVEILERLIAVDLLDRDAELAGDATQKMAFLIAPGAFRGVPLDQHDAIGLAAMIRRRCKSPGDGIRIFDDRPRLLAECLVEHGGKPCQGLVSRGRIESVIGGELEALGGPFRHQAARRGEDLDDLQRRHIQRVARIDAAPHRVNHARENILLEEMRLDCGNVAAHPAGADPAAMGIVNRHGGHHDAGAAAVLAPDPDLDIAIAMLDAEGARPGHVREQRGRQNAAQLARGVAEAALGRDIAERAVDIGLPAKIGRAFHEIAIKLARRDEGVDDVALAGDVAAEDENAVFGIRHFAMDMGQGQLEGAFGFVGPEAHPDHAVPAFRHPPGDSGSQGLAVRAFQEIGKAPGGGVRDHHLAPRIDHQGGAGIGVRQGPRDPSREAGCFGGNGAVRRLVRRAVRGISHLSFSRM